MPRLTNDELRTYYRRVHGLAEDETYDPDRHGQVPALAFGELPEDEQEGTPLAPEADLNRSVHSYGPLIGEPWPKV